MVQSPFPSTQQYGFPIPRRKKALVIIFIMTDLMMTIITKATCTSSKRPPRNGHEKPLDPSRHCTFERASAASDQGWRVIIMLILIETEMILLIAITF